MRNAGIGLTMATLSLFASFESSAQEADPVSSPNAQAEPSVPPEPVAPAEPETLPSPQPLAGDGVTELDPIEITGSRIRRIQAEGPSPVITISREQISAEGAVSIQDVLANLSQNQGGTLSNQGGLFGTDGSASSVDLRTFGSGRTLVLLDGRRLPVFPTDFSGSQPVDLSSIPFAMIERIEILTDGASAIYGSDAVGGVINVITRKKPEGRSATARFGGTQQGGYANRRLQYFDGIGADFGTVTFTADYFENKPLRISQREYSESDFTGNGNGSLFGSNFAPNDATPFVADPDCGTPDDALGGLGVVASDGRCRFDRSPWRQYFPAYQNTSASLRLDRALSGALSDINAYSRLTYLKSSTRAQAEPNAYGGGEGFRPGTTQIIPDSVHNFGEVPAGAANDPDGSGGFFNRRLVEFGGRQQDSDVRATSFLQGFTSTFWDVFTWDVGFSFSQIELETRRPNILSSPLDNEVANNGLDLFEPIPQDIVDRFSFTALKTSKSKSTLLDATVSGPLMALQMAGGPVQLAVHTDLEKAFFQDLFDPLTLRGDTFDGGLSGSGDRKYTGLGVELLLPVLSNLEVTLAGRYDRYFDDSAVGGAFSPKAAVAYRPTDSVLLRASAGKSFRAPSMQDLFGGQSIGFVSVSDPVQCINEGGTPDDNTSPIPSCNPDDPFYAVQSAPVLSGANQDLREETGRNYNAGLVWEFIKDVSVSVDVYRVELEDIVSALDAQEILNLCAFQGQFCDNILRPATDTNADGQVLDEIGAFITTTNQNLAFREITGIDVGLNHLLDLDRLGRFKSSVNVSYIDTLKTQSLPGGVIEEVIKSAPNTQERVPEWRGTVNTDWALGPLGARLGVNFTDAIPGEYTPTGQYGNVPKEDYIASFTTWDAQVRYDLGPIGLFRVGVDNVFDREWPLDPTAGGGLRPNQFITGPATSYVSPLGRSGYLQYEYRF